MRITSVAVLIVLCGRLLGIAADFYVAPSGDDSHSGGLAETSGDDGPFATLSRALAAVRRLRLIEPDRDSPVTIQLRGGIYCLDGPVRLSAEDSGTADSPLVVEAFPSEEPILSGGKLLGDWEDVGDGRWTQNVPGVSSGNWRFEQLYVNNQRRFRPLLPRDGYYFVEAPVGGTSLWNQDRFQFRSGDLNADWKNLKEVQVLAFHKWSISRIPIRKIDSESLICDLEGSTWSFELAPLHRETWYRVENVYEALRDPGQWYLDRSSGQLSYIPVAGELPDQTTAIAPRMSQVVSMVGDAKRRKPLQYVVLRGLTFAHTGWECPLKGYSAYQAEKGIDAAVTLKYVRDCRIVGCVFRHTANYGLQIGVGCHDVTVEECEFFDLGAGGIRVGSDRFNEEPDKTKWTSRCTVRDNLVAHGGRVHPGAVGIWIAHAHDCVVEHNRIEDLYYSGVSIGWCWATGPSPATNNTVAYNLIQNIGQNVLSDLAGIYTLGHSPGTAVHHNRIDRVSRARYGGWGIYFDANSGEIVAENNIVTNTEDGGFHQHYGSDNVVRNNIFAFAANHPLQLTNARSSGKTTIERNIWYWDKSKFFEGKLDDEVVFLDNLYWKYSGQTIEFPLQQTAEEWKKREPNFVVVDPRFRDPSDGDFSMPENGPAQQIGFEAIELGDVGCRTRRTRTESLPTVPSAFLPAPEPPRLVIEEDFEMQPTGRIPAGWGQTAASPEENVRIVDTAAATGEQCLQFNDGPGGAAYFPHLYRDISYPTGKVMVSFDARLEDGAHLQFEWRDKDPWYSAGPSIDVKSDGTLLASGSELMKVPTGVWFNVKMTCRVGAGATGTYDVDVVLAGDSKLRRFTGIKHSDGFETIDWFGFCCMATRRVAYYIDNLVIKPVD